MSEKLILRKESFGGILFDPEDATIVEIDGTAFEFLKSFLKKSQKARSEEEKKLLENLSKELNLKKDARIIELLIPDSNSQILSSPTLIDIMITRKCYQDCPHCYADASASGEHIKTEEIFRIINEASELGVLQLAIGGGEPTLHPDFTEILAYSRKKGLLPNLTTSGDNLTPRILKGMKKHAGAVGLSLEATQDAFAVTRKGGFEKFRESVSLLLEKEIPLVFQFTLSSDNLDHLTSFVNYALSVDKLYGVLFLTHKKAGRAKNFKRLLSEVPLEKLYSSIKEAFLALSKKTRVGYDVCLTPALIPLEKEYFSSRKNIFSGCSAMRSSLAITPDLDIVPCSFWPLEKMGNLKEKSIAEIWNSEKARDFRKKQESHLENNLKCKNCEYKLSCLGGCPFEGLVNCHLNYLGK